MATPNLDAMDGATLARWRRDNPEHPAAPFAHLILWAQNHRLAGRIAAALECEAWAEEVYANLHPDDKW